MCGWATAGEMPLYYALADVALLDDGCRAGKSLIEAAACPVVLGPHTFNFAQAAEDACASGAAQRVAATWRRPCALRWRGCMTRPRDDILAEPNRCCQWVFCVKVDL